MRCWQDQAKARRQRTRTQLSHELGKKPELRNVRNSIFGWIGHPCSHVGCVLSHLRFLKMFSSNYILSNNSRLVRMLVKFRSMALQPLQHVQVRSPTSEGMLGSLSAPVTWGPSTSLFGQTLRVACVACLPCFELPTTGLDPERVLARSEKLQQFLRHQCNQPPLYQPSSPSPTTTSPNIPQTPP